MIYPKEVKEEIDVLDSYSENNELKEFNILHLYPKNLAFPEGFYDSRFFELIAFNTEKKEKVNLGIHDGIIYDDRCDLVLTRIFVDGSTMLRFKNFLRTSFHGNEIRLKLS